jgi:hypothetical protein
VAVSGRRDVLVISFREIKPCVWVIDRTIAPEPVEDEKRGDGQVPLGPVPDWGEILTSAMAGDP